MVLAAALVIATVDTTRRIVKKGAMRKPPAIATNEVCTSLAVAALAVLPWVRGGWIPSPSDFVPSLLLALAIGFTSTATVTMSVFDAAKVSSRAPEPAAPLRGSTTRRRRRPRRAAEAAPSRPEGRGGDDDVGDDRCVDAASMART